MHREWSNWFKMSILNWCKANFSTLLNASRAVLRRPPLRLPVRCPRNGSVLLFRTLALRLCACAGGIKLVSPRGGWWRGQRLCLGHVASHARGRSSGGSRMHALCPCSDIRACASSVGSALPVAVLLQWSISALAATAATAATAGLRRITATLNPPHTHTFRWGLSLETWLRCRRRPE